MTPANVLLVDDEVGFVEAMGKRLAKRGFNIDSVFSGREALDRLASGAGARTDVVLLDVKMPGLGGIDVLGEIKRRYPLIEVIMLTGHGTMEAAIEGMKMGAFDFLMKPAEMEGLVAKLQAATDKKRQHEEKIVEARAQMIAMRRGD